MHVIMMCRSIFLAAFHFTASIKGKWTQALGITFMEMQRALPSRTMGSTQRLTCG